MPPSIPDKAYFKIGEAARIVGVPAYVLRYWETEFEVLRPEKSRSNQRVYRRNDLETLIEIKRLLYEEGFTILGARKTLRAARRNDGEARLRASHERLRRAMDRACEEARQLLALVDAKDDESEED